MANKSSVFDSIRPTPEARGKGAAISSFLAQGGPLGSKMGKPGMFYTQGKLKGKTQDQAVQEATRLWDSAPNSIREKYARRESAAALSNREKMDQGFIDPNESEEEKTKRANASIQKNGPNPSTTQNGVNPKTGQPAQTNTETPTKPAPTSPPVSTGANTGKPSQSESSAESVGGTMGARAGAALAGGPTPAVNKDTQEAALDKSLNDAMAKNREMPPDNVFDDAAEATNAANASVTGANKYIGKNAPDSSYTLTGSIGGQNLWEKGIEAPRAATAEEYASATRSMEKDRNEGRGAFSGILSTKPQSKGVFDRPETSYTPGLGFVPKAKVVTGPEATISDDQYQAARNRRTNPGSTAAQDKKDFAVETEYGRQQMAKRSDNDGKKWRARMGI